MLPLLSRRCRYQTRTIELQGVLTMIPWRSAERNYDCKCWCCGCWCVAVGLLSRHGGKMRAEGHELLPSGPRTSPTEGCCLCSLHQRRTRVRAAIPRYAPVSRNGFTHARFPLRCEIVTMQTMYRIILAQGATSFCVASHKFVVDEACFGFVHCIYRMGLLVKAGTSIPIECVSVSFHISVFFFSGSYPWS